MLIRHVLGYLPARIIPGMVNFVALGLYTRFLRPEEYGRYTLVLALVGLVQSVFFQWLRLGALRFYQVMERDQRLPALLSTVMGNFVVTALVVGVGWSGLLILLPLDDALRSALWYGLPLLWTQALFQQSLEHHRAATEVARYGMFAAGRAVVGLAASTGFIVALGWAEQGVLLGLALGSLVPALMDVRRWRYLVAVKWIDRKLTIDLLQYGGPLTVTFALSFVISTSDRLFIQYFLDSGSVGLYAAGYDLSRQMLTLLFMVVNLAAYPLAVKALERGGHDEASVQLRQNAVLFFGLAMPATVGFAMIASSLSTLVLGASFRDQAAQIMPWIALSTFLAGAKAYYFDLAFQLGKRTYLQIWPVAAGALTNLALNLWLIPSLGLMGAVYATVIAYLASLILSGTLGGKVFRLPLPVGDLAKLLIATLAMATALAFLPFGEDWASIGFVIAISAGVYAGAVWVLNPAKVRYKLRESIHARTASRGT